MVAISELSRMEKMGEGSAAEHRLYVEEGLRWGDMFVHYLDIHTGLSTETKEILQIIFPYLRHIQSLPFSSGASLSSILLPA